MRRLTFLSLLGVGLLTAATPQETFNAVINKYAAANSLKANFSEKICSKSQGTCQELRGTFLYSSPNKFRLDVVIPMEQLVVSDGTTFWIYLPTQSQAIKTNPGPEQQLFLFASSLKDYHKTYTVSVKQVENMVEATFKAKPDQQPFLKEFTLVLDPKTNDIEDIKITEGDSEITFSLISLKLNVSTSPNQFLFDPPEGTTIIKDTGTGYQ